MFSNWFNEDFDQTPLIENYNDILKLYQNKYPEDARKKQYVPLDNNGICSGLGTEWVRRAYSSNPESKKELFVMQKLILSYKKHEINYIFTKKTKKEVEEMLDFGLAIQLVHKGKDLSSNFESKQFRNMMQVTWLYSTPLIKKSNEDIFELCIAPNQVYRFYSKKHIIPVITTTDSISIYDANGGGEKTFRLNQPLKALKYLKERFSLVGQPLESVSVFTPCYWTNPLLNPPRYSEIIKILRGNPSANLIDSSAGLQQSLGDLDEQIKKIQPPEINIKKLFDETKQVLSELEIGSRPIKIVLNDIETKLNELTQSIKKIAQLQKFEKDLSAFSLLLGKYKLLDVDYDIERIIHGINYNTHQLLNAKKDIPMLKKVIQYAQDYDTGTKPLSEIIFYLHSYLTVLKNRFNLSNEYQHFINYFEKLLAHGNFIQTKQKILKAITQSNHQEPCDRDLLFVAIELGDTETIITMLQKFPFNLNKPVDGLLPLQVAITINNPEIVLLLLKHKANPCFIDAKNICLLQYDYTLRNPDIAIALLKAGAVSQLYHSDGYSAAFIKTIIQNYSGNSKLENSQAAAAAIAQFLLEVYPDKIVLSDKLALMKQAQKLNDKELLRLIPEGVADFSEPLALNFHRVFTPSPSLQNNEKEFNLQNDKNPSPPK